MFAIATASLLALVNQVSGTPYISGGDTAHGTDCSGLASWVANAASGRPVYGNRFNTGNEEAALRARGFLPGSAPGALNIGWNGGHTAVTLPDGTPVSSGESGGGVRIGGGGAFQRQFTHHMHLPMAVGDDLPADLPLDGPQDPPLAGPAGPADIPAPDIAPPPAVIEAANFAPAPDAPAPAPEAPAPAPEGPEMAS
ncbi:glycoside hydrolase [Mycobacterium sp. CBMA 234]|uniref:peptidoglycan endopeptidase n=1 Tax=Mycolicibacterium sp. CBMA 234 TaxID=1918495 RepID=UPI0012DF2803|nr:peptidoglycan endopeptidase [Mycolicibacterium sp. CBMA 234]MUL67804.1 glycoside hydrolase [Mycolicibacterium sp. CBMA 234]